MNLIQSTILTSLPAGKKKTPSGWIAFNAPCCIHNGENADRRKRGGIMNSPDGTLSFHCFNCGFKTSYTPGRKISLKTKKWMAWLGIDDNTIKKMVIEAMRLEEADKTAGVEKKKFISFNKKSLPKNSHKLDIWLEKYLKKDLTEKQHRYIDLLLNYLKERGIGPDWYNFMYSPDMTFDINKRIIIPFYWKGEVVGYTGRLIEKIDKLKYYTDVQPGYVFNMDVQDWARQFVIVTEGPFDAISISGVSILGSEVNDTQRELIDNLNRKVIVVPDKDKAGSKLIEQAIEYRWSVAFPEWGQGVDDVADAVLKYGRLFTIQSILKSTESNRLKIDLKRKMYGRV